MTSPAIPTNERTRLNAVRQLGLLDSLPQAAFDNITGLAKEVCHTSIALITMVDEHKQWFKSKKGLQASETPREISFCGHAILNPKEIFEVENALEDSRFQDNPLVLSEEVHLRSYAGIPLLTMEGEALGTLCVINKEPHKLNFHQRKTLISLGKQVEILYEYHRKNTELEKLRDEQSENNKLLKEFAGNVSHDLKMPLANIILTADIIKAKFSKILDEQGVGYLDYIKKSGLMLSEYVTSLLEYYAENKEKIQEVDEFYLNDLLEDIIDLLNIDSHCDIVFPENNVAITANRAALGQVLLNLISNSLKHHSKDEIRVEIGCEEKAGQYYFTVKDNGDGIPKEQLKSIFNLFTVFNDTQGKHHVSHGIGLSIVKKLVGNMEGEIDVSSRCGYGTEFNFSIRKAEIMR